MQISAVSRDATSDVDTWRFAVIDDVAITERAIVEGVCCADSVECESRKWRWTLSRCWSLPKRNE